MKLHSLLLTAALFLTVGAAFAQDNLNNGQAKKILGTIELNTQDSYSWNPNYSGGPTHDNLVKESVLNVRMIRMNGNGNGDSDTGWSYLVGGYRANGDDLETALSNGRLVENYNIANDLQGLTPAQIEAIGFYAGNHSAYDFTVSFGANQPIESFGLIGTVQERLESINNVTDNENQNKFYTLGDTNILYYGTPNKFPNNGALFIVSAGTNVKLAEQTFGSPLPAPVVTLLIALGFGVALVMYRNRKAKA